MERLVKAGAGPVTITPLAVMGLSTNPAMYFGYYTPGTGSGKTQLFTVPTADAQTVNPSVNGSLSFDPADTMFGLYTTWPGFKNADNITLRDVYSEDALNDWSSADTHKYRFYQMKNPDGTVVPDTYVVAVEEYTTDVDSNDIVFVISNVKAAAVGSEIGYENLDNVGFDNRLVFTKINNKNTTYPDKSHDTVTLRIRNTGNADLVLGSMSVSSSWAVQNAPTGSAATIAPGAHYDLVVKLVASGTGYRTGTLTIRSNDSDEATLQIQLAGYVQHQSEAGFEPGLQTLINLFGYTTQALYSGQSFSSTKDKVTPLGDEIISAYWQRADSAQPVTARYLAAYHTQGNTSSVGYFNKGSTNVSNIVTHDRYEGQSILPHKSGTSYATPAMGTFNTSNTFGFKIDNERSDPALNTQTQVGGGQNMRFYAAKDQAGNVIANTYIVVMDYSNATPPNYDFQDNVLIITNIKPEAPATPSAVLATGDGAGVELDWADNSQWNLKGYDVYRSSTSGGTYTKLNDAPLTASQFTDLTAPVGATSYYRIIAVDNFGSSSVAATANATRPAPPAAPTGLMLTGSQAGISIDWADNLESDLLGYNVYASTTNQKGSFTRLNPSALVASSFEDTTAVAGATTYYRVTAIDLEGLESDFIGGNAARLV